MLSFFLKKRQGPDTPPEENTQDTPALNMADDFIFVEKKSGDDPPRRPQPPPPHMYPPMPSAFGATPYPSVPYPPHGSNSNNVNINQFVVPYLQDVPFVLAPQLCVKNDFDLTQTQVDGILALLTRQMAMEENEEYSFALERSMRNECY